MDKTLEFTTKSPRQIKQGDTETMFTFICKSAGSAVDLTQATSITAKIGNASGYLRSQPIAITSLTGLKPGWFNLQPMPTLISGLPAGDYQLEIWVVDPAGTSIYPSDNPLSFTVTSNLESRSGTTITTIAFDDFVEAVNKAASTIAKGDKGDTGPQGDTGTVDNAGLIAAPAFVKLQTQVNDSAAGTNLLTGTNNTLTTVTNVTGWGDGLPAYHPAEKLKANQTYTLSCYLEPAAHDASIFMKIAHRNAMGTVIAAGSKGISTLTITLTQEDVETVSNFWIAFCNNQTDKSTVSFRGFKLEKGSVATDWCPNPSEILTQADYAKIKAAIVALGGSLS
ncbi:collagen-like protein [Lactiplantibacillus plantarum]|uniref:collagen-like protein n=1 Tax=Lactiplantibacillus plantarum TaxID=1590 RepID=UPI001059050B|nr:collagen-like protein [Lactiplantibacillus plantarum]QIA84152.1 collagen-like protein [Lactiplantibacillus plantarum]QVG75285.1 collagen-like protein [Lactiplantibacillus plantarum]TDH43638.1 collagen-like protein [Lactiplantibacillus plantarum]